MQQNFWIVFQRKYSYSFLDWIKSFFIDPHVWKNPIYDYFVNCKEIRSFKIINEDENILDLECICTKKTFEKLKLLQYFEKGGLAATMSFE